MPKITTANAAISPSNATPPVAASALGHWSEIGKKSDKTRPDRGSNASTNIPFHLLTGLALGALGTYVMCRIFSERAGRKKGQKSAQMEQTLRENARQLLQLSASNEQLEGDKAALVAQLARLEKLASATEDERSLSSDQEGDEDSHSELIDLREQNLQLQEEKIALQAMIAKLSQPGVSSDIKTDSHEMLRPGGDTSPDQLAFETGDAPAEEPEKSAQSRDLEQENRDLKLALANMESGQRNQINADAMREVIAAKFPELTPSDAPESLTGTLTTLANKSPEELVVLANKHQKTIRAQYKELVLLKEHVQVLTTQRGIGAISKSQP